MTYVPPQRAVGAFIFSLDRWIRGTFHLPKLHAFEEHLAKRRAFFPLTDVELGTGGSLDFLALRASAAHIIIPEEPQRDLRLREVTGVPREVSCYLAQVAVHGKLELLPGVRTSDFLAHQKGFIMLHGCRLVPSLPMRPEPVPVIFVNAGALLAVAEEGDSMGGRDETPLRTPVPVK